MVVNRRKKVVKYRGHTTHGGGHRKKRRGAGSRGGHGWAGTGKRAGQKKAAMKTWSLGQRGFTSLKAMQQGTERIINVEDFTLPRVEAWVQEGKATKEGKKYVVDLTSLGYAKLLGSGAMIMPVTITVEKCSPKAAEKVNAAGGSVNTAKKTEKTQKSK